MITKTKKKTSRLTQPIGRSKTAVGLDIEAGSVAATELSVNGRISVDRYGITPLPAGAVRDGEVQDPEVLGEAIKELFADQKLNRDVRAGIANQQVAVRTIRLPRIDDRNELEAAVRFAAQDHIPMPLDRAVLDWQEIPASAEAIEQNQVEIVIAAARREMLSGLVEATRRAGVRLVGIDHSAFALIRALKDSDPVTVADPIATDDASEGAEPAPARGASLLCHLGDITNLVVSRNSVCLFSRVVGFGIEGIAQTLSSGSGLTLEHARQWLIHVGLADPIDEIEGDPRTVAQTREALASGAGTMVEELRRSVEYYAALEGAVPIDRILVAGPGVAIPGLADRLDRELPVPLITCVPDALATTGAAAGRLTLSYGLGLEE